MRHLTAAQQAWLATDAALDESHAPGAGRDIPVLSGRLRSPSPGEPRPSGPSPVKDEIGKDRSSSGTGREREEKIFCMHGRGRGNVARYEPFDYRCSASPKIPLHRFLGSVITHLCRLAKPGPEWSGPRARPANEGVAWVLSHLVLSPML